MTISDILLIILIVVTALVGLAYVRVQKRTRYTLEMAKWEHFGDLRNVIDKWKGQVGVPEPYNVCSDGIQQTLDVESDPNFESLRRHLRKEKGLWENHERFKQLRISYFYECNALFVRICEECQESTCIMLGDWNETQIIDNSFPTSIYKNTFYHAESIPGLEGGEYKTESSKDVQQLWFGNRGLAKGSSETVERCERVHREMMGSTGRYSESVNQILNLQSDTNTLGGEISQALKKLSLRRTFPGKCEICN